MSRKPTGLAAFTGGRGAPDKQEQSRPVPTERKRGKGDTVALTVRLSRADWMRLHQLAMAEGISLQALAVKGFSAVLSEHGLPPMTD